MCCEKSFAVAVSAAVLLLAGCSQDVIAPLLPEPDTPVDTLPGYTYGKTTCFASFVFTVADNKGKILDKEVYYDGYRTTVRDVREQALEIDSQGNASLCIPYLYDYTLIPRFTLKDSGPYEVYVGGERQVSGQSAQDFLRSVTYSICDTLERVKEDFTVTVQGTGLPVMVISTHSSYSQTREFLDLEVPAKSSEFILGDEVSLYSGGEQVLESSICSYRLRGNITRQYPKKSFALKLSTRESLLGMPKHKRWALLANWKDNTLLRNDLALWLAREFTSQFEDGMMWNPSGQFVELVLDGRHIGTYWLCEQIRIDKNRLDISAPYEEQPAPSFENCGYLLEFDNYYDEAYKFLINGKQTLPVNCKTPFDETQSGRAIFKSLQERLEKLDDRISDGDFEGAYELLDINSSADYMLLQELVMNNEYKHPRSCYAYMDGGDDKLHFGPCWDYDVWTFPVIDNIRYYNYETYVHRYDDFQFDTEVMNPTSTYVWFKLLSEDQVFRSTLKERWAAITSSGRITPSKVDDYIDGRVLEISTSVEYNRAMWPHPCREYTDDYMNADETTAAGGSGTLYSYPETIALLKQAYAARYEGLSKAVNK